VVPTVTDIQIPKPDQPDPIKPREDNFPDNWYPDPLKSSSRYSSFPNGLKIKETGYSLPSSKRKSGLDSELKVHKIATAFDLANLGVNRRVKKTAKR
jgi:hypothetical protein